MVYVNYTVGPIIPQWNYTPHWGVLNGSWPPPGKRLTVNYAAPPDPGPDNFTELAGIGVGCASPLTCLTGWPSCDNSSVPGQCTFPRATAVSECAAWPACVAVNCADSRGDCQARSSLSQLSPGGFTSFVRGGFFPYPALSAAVVYEMYDGVPALSKWVQVTNSDASSVPFLRQVCAGSESVTVACVNPGSSSLTSPMQATIEQLHVPWEKRARMHAETAYMPSQGIRNRWECGL